MRRKNTKHLWFWTSKEIYINDNHEIKMFLKIDLMFYFFKQCWISSVSSLIMSVLGIFISASLNNT